MADLQKFRADAQRCVKHYRANNPEYDGLKAGKAVVALFVSYNRDMEVLAQGIGEYWLKTYIELSQNPAVEPSAEHIDWLLDVLSFFEADMENGYVFTSRDWDEIHQLVDCEAGDLPLDILSGMMSVLVARKVL